MRIFGKFSEKKRKAEKFLKNTGKKEEIETIPQRSKGYHDLEIMSNFAETAGKETGTIFLEDLCYNKSKAKREQKQAAKSQE